MALVAVLVQPAVIRGRGKPAAAGLSRFCVMLPACLGAQAVCGSDAQSFNLHVQACPWGRGGQREKERKRKHKLYSSACSVHASAASRISGQKLPDLSLACLLRQAP